MVLLPAGSGNDCVSHTNYKFLKNKSKGAGHPTGHHEPIDLRLGHCSWDSLERANDISPYQRNGLLNGPLEHSWLEKYLYEENEFNSFFSSGWKRKKQSEGVTEVYGVMNVTWR